MQILKLVVLFAFFSLSLSACIRTYTVKSGDTCGAIAASQGVSLDIIYQLNPSVNSQCTNLEVGQVLCLATNGSNGGGNATLTTVYGIWHCGTDCAWTSKPDLSSSAWILNRGDGKPTTDVVILSFMDPIALVNGQNSGGYTNGVPNGMIQSYTYFTSKGIRVIFSIGGAAWSSRFVSALQQNAAQLAKNAAACALKYDVGIEIDVEVDNNSYASQLTTFVDTFRATIAYNGSPDAPSHTILNIDVGAGTGFLGSLATLARGWVASNKINWVNAMVSDKPWTNINDATNAWQQHLNAGLPANRLVVCHYGSNTCNTYSGILQQTVSWAQSKHVRGISFWAAGAGGGEYVSNCKGIEQGSQAFLV